MSEYTFRVEVMHGQDQREVNADKFAEQDGWLVFYRKPPQGGTIEYWRVRLDCVVSMETCKRGGQNNG